MGAVLAGAWSPEAPVLLSLSALLTFQRSPSPTTFGRYDRRLEVRGSLCEQVRW